MSPEQQLRERMVRQLENMRRAQYLDSHSPAIITVATLAGLLTLVTVDTPIALVIYADTIPMISAWSWSRA